MTVKNMMKMTLIAIIISIPIFMSPTISIYGSGHVFEGIIESNGMVLVKTNVTVNAGLNQVVLPIEPIPETISVTEYGIGIPPIYHNMTLVIPVEKGGVATIKYTANVSIVGGRITLKIGRGEIRLKVMKGIVLLSMPENITSVKTEDGILIMDFTGPTEISYTIAKPSKVPEKTKFISVISWWPIVIGSILLIISILLIYRFLHRESEELDQLDREIIEVLKRKGGRALQTELMTELHVPKTTLWRHVKRLERYEYVEIEKIGRVNIVKLRGK